MAAESVQKWPKYANDDKIQKLTFSSGYIAGLLRRQALRRRKITNVTKPRPSDEEINQHMKQYQDIMVAKKLTANQTANFDETAFHPGSGPRYKYVTKDTQRASGTSDDKTRITAVIQSNAAGEFAPTMFILRHAKKHTSLTTPDQRKMRVLKQLHKLEGFRAADGWDLREWRRELEVPDKDGNLVKKMHYKLILKHRVSGQVIVSQCKAWMDTTTMAVYLDEICEPIRRKEGALLLWSDNCGSHCTKCIADLYKALDIIDAKYPKNCTDIIQPMDLSVNSAVKQHVRRNNAQAIVKDMQQHNRDLAAELQKPVAERQNLQFTPSKPTMHNAITQFYELFDNQLATEKYKQSLARTFVNTGSFFEDTKAMTFRPFSSVKNNVQGKVNIVPSNAQPVAEQLVEPELTQEQTETETGDINEQMATVLEGFLDDLEENRLFVGEHDENSDDSDSDGECDSDDEEEEL